MPYVPNTPEDYDVDEATDRLLERYTPGSPVEAAPRRQLHYVNHLGGTHDGLLSYNYTKKAKYALKLPERNEDCSRAPRQWDRCSQIQEERKLASGPFMITSAQMGHWVGA